jgi:hypothetical protein
MKYNIWHWYCKCPPVPEAIKDREPVGKSMPGYIVKLPDTLDALMDFVKKHGAIQLRPPNENCPEMFTIVVTKGNKFTQC